jgi:hypothetical protein
MNFSIDLILDQKLYSSLDSIGSQAKGEPHASMGCSAIISQNFENLQV